MHINKIIVTLSISSAVLFSCGNTQDETDLPVPQRVTEEFEGIETLFDETAFEYPESVELLREINICSDEQVDGEGNPVTPCSPELFKFFPLKEGTPLNDGFILLVKANTGGIALRRVLVFERENGALVKVNGFIGNLIGTKKKAGSNNDLLIRFIDKIEGSDVFYHCIFSWENGKYEFKTVEVIHEPAGDFYGRVKESVKDSVSQDIFKILMDNKMIF